MSHLSENPSLEEAIQKREELMSKYPPTAQSLAQDDASPASVPPTEQETSSSSSATPQDQQAVPPPSSVLASAPLSRSQAIANAVRARLSDPSFRLSHKEKEKEPDSELKGTGQSTDPIYVIVSECKQ